MPRGTPEQGLGRRLAWFAALWLLGVVSVGAVGLLIRLALH